MSDLLECRENLTAPIGARFFLAKGAIARRRPPDESRAARSRDPSRRTSSAMPVEYTDEHIIYLHRLNAEVHHWIAQGQLWMAHDAENTAKMVLARPSSLERVKSERNATDMFVPGKRLRRQNYG
jgi:hypothetical protein